MTGNGDERYCFLPTVSPQLTADWTITSVFSLEKVSWENPHLQLQLYMSKWFPEKVDCQAVFPRIRLMARYKTRMFCYCKACRVNYIKKIRGKQINKCNLQADKSRKEFLLKKCKIQREKTSLGFERLGNKLDYAFLCRPARH